MSAPPAQARTALVFTTFLGVRTAMAGCDVVLHLAALIFAPDLWILRASQGPATSRRIQQKWRLP